MNTEDLYGGENTRPRVTFRFEAGWVEEEQCGVIIENAWKLATQVRGEKVENAVKGVASDLWDWSKNILGDLERRIKFVCNKLELCRRMLISAHTRAERADFKV